MFSSLSGCSDYILVRFFGSMFCDLLDHISSNRSLVCVFEIESTVDSSNGFIAGRFSPYLYIYVKGLQIEINQSSESGIQ